MPPIDWLYLIIKTYGFVGKVALFTFNNIHPATDGVTFQFQGNAAGGSGYNETMTSTYFRAFNGEGGEGADLEYQASQDQAQGTSFEPIGQGLGNDNDQSLSGYLHLFNPSSTVFVKHFLSKCNFPSSDNYSYNIFKAGYFNTTSAIDEIQFKMSSGNIDAGDICLYGIN